MSPDERFWSKVAVGDNCWEWTACKNWQGRGLFQFRGRLAPAPRVAYELARGPIPPGMLVCHHCDNPGCVRPCHLFLGTHSDNMLDRNAKGRQARGARQGTHTKPESRSRGESNGAAKLRTEDVLAIRASGETQDALARRYGVAQTVISSIRLRKTWRHVT